MNPKSLSGSSVAGPEVDAGISPAPLAASRNAVLDWLRVLLAVMVVALHGQFLDEIDSELHYFLENYLFRIAVPLFFVINGYFFAEALARSPTAWKTWVLRVLTLYGVWSLIYLYPIVSKGPALAASNLFFGYWHLWYLLCAAQTSLVVYACRRMRPSTLAAVLVATYGLGLFLQYAGNYHLFGPGTVDSVINFYPVYRNFLLFGLPMFGAGYLLARVKADEMSVGSASLVTAAGVAAMLIEYRFNTWAGVNPSESFDLLAFLPLLCVGIFLLALKGNGLLRQPGFDLAALSASIFFVHVLVLQTLFYFGLREPTPLVVAAVAVSALSYPVLIRLNRRWPVFL